LHRYCSCKSNYYRSDHSKAWIIDWQNLINIPDWIQD
jgi:hypothetical protein